MDGWMDGLGDPFLALSVTLIVSMNLSKTRQQGFSGPNLWELIGFS